MGREDERDAGLQDLWLSRCDLDVYPDAWQVEPQIARQLLKSVIPIRGGVLLISLSSLRIACAQLIKRKGLFFSELILLNWWILGAVKRKWRSPPSLRLFVGCLCHFVMLRPAKRCFLLKVPLLATTFCSGPCSKCHLSLQGRALTLAEDERS